VTILSNNIGASRFKYHCLWVFITTLTLYLITLGPTFSWGDHADLPHRVIDWQDGTFYFARTYLLYRTLAQAFVAFPVGDIAYRLNLMTAVFGAATVMLVFTIVKLRTDSLRAAWGAALALAFSHTLWFLSVIAEVYSLATFLLCLTLLFALRVLEKQPKTWEIAAFGFSLGLFLSHHFAAILVFPAAGLLMLRFLKKPKLLAAFCCALLLGTSLFLVQFTQTWSAYGWVGIQDTFQTNQLGLYRSNWQRESVLFVAYLLYQFPGIGFAAGMGWLLFSPKFIQLRDLFLLAVMATLVIWGVTNPIPDKFNAYVFFYPLFAILIGMGIHAAEKSLLLKIGDMRKQVWLRQATLALIPTLPVLLYAVTPLICERLNIDLVKARTCPFRDNNRFFLQPWKQGDEGARQFATQALADADPNSVIVVVYTLWRPMLYLQRVEGIRPDVQLVWVEPLQKQDAVVDFIKTTIAKKPLYLAAVEPMHYYDYDRVRRYYQAEQDGLLYRLSPREETQAEQVRLN
jgi:hypothetical protein